MKKIILTLTIITSSLSFANDNNVQITYTNAEMAPPPPQGKENDGLGGKDVPINDYAGVLIITAITIAGITVYKKQKQLN